MTTPNCASCRRGENDSVQPEALVSYYYLDEERPVREWLCTQHLDMVYDEEGYSVADGSIRILKEFPKEGSR